MCCTKTQHSKINKQISPLPLQKLSFCRRFPEQTFARLPGSPMCISNLVLFLPRHHWSWTPTTSLNTSSSGAVKTHLSRAAKAQQSLFKLERRSYVFFLGYIWMSKAVWIPWALQGNLSVSSGSVRLCLFLSYIHTQRLFLSRGPQYQNPTKNRKTSIPSKASPSHYSSCSLSGLPLSSRPSDNDS